MGAHNLPFVHACAVLNEVLRQLRDEGRFACDGRTLGALVGASKDQLPWCDFVATTELVKRRNEVAHDAKLVPRGECWQYIDAIKAQLLAWGVLQSEDDGPEGQPDQVASQDG